VQPGYTSKGGRGPTAPPPLPLEGIRILDMTAWWAGPSACHLFAALGADAIHLESTTMLERNSEHHFLVGFLLFALVLLCKLPVLDTPYLWDEVLWIGFAHRLTDMDLWRVLPGFHPAFSFGNRPPGLFLSAAGLFQVFGSSIWLSHLLIAGFSFLGVYFTYRLGHLLYGFRAGLLACLCLFFNGIYFAQSAMFLSDLPVAALGVTTIYFALRKKYIPYLISTLYLLSLKETALAIEVSLLAYLWLTERPSKEWLRYSVPLVAIAAYYAWQKLATGHLFVHYTYEFEPFRLSLSAALEQLPRVNRWLLWMQFRWIFTILIAAALLSKPAFRRHKELLLFSMILVSSGYSFAFLYYLPRYLLPVAPYFFIVAAGALVHLIRGRRLQLLVGVSALALLSYAVLGNDRVGTREWNMGYLDVVRIHKAMCQYVEAEFPDVPILAAFPLSSYLSRPELGYVSRPLRVVTVQGLQRAQEDGPVNLVVYASPGTNLEDHVAARGLRLIERFEEEGIRAELYGVTHDD